MASTRSSQRGRGTRSYGKANGSAQHADDSQEVQGLRSKYGHHLDMAQSVFPAWSDEDLLYALSEANGDLNVALTRISDGQTQQWGSVKTRKDKKAIVPPAFDEPSPPSESFSARGGRGRASGMRGGRGGGRGGRGGAFGRGGAHVNGVPKQPDAAPEWQESSSWADTPANAPTSWADEPAQDPPKDAVAAEDAPGPATSSGGWGDEQLPAKPANSGWGDEPTTTVDAPPSADGWGTEATPSTIKTSAQPVFVAKKTIPAGTKFTWAQVARPKSPPKPAPAPAKQAPQPVQAAPAPKQEEQKPVSNDPWAETPAAAAAPEETAEQSAPEQAMGIGEGWADSVAASAETPRTAEAEAAAPAAGIDPAGAIHMHTPSIEETAGNAILPSEAVSAQPAVKDDTTHAPPPGLPSSNQAPTVQFGSLNLQEQAPQPVESAKPVTEQIHQQSQPAYEQQSGFPQQQTHEQPSQQHQQQPPFAQYAPIGQPSPYAQQQPASQHSANAPFGNRYPQPSPYLSQAGHTHQNSADSFGLPSFGSPYSAQVGSTPSTNDPYFQHQQHAQSLQQTQQPIHPSVSPAQQPAREVSQPSTQQQSSYGSFNSAPGAHHLPQQQHFGAQPSPFSAPGPQNPMASDYASLYGQDALRQMGFFNHYDQQSQQRQHSSEEKSSTPQPGQQGSTTPGVAAPSAQQGQQSMNSAPGAPYGNMMGYPPAYPPYGYYGNYGNYGSHHPGAGYPNQYMQHGGSPYGYNYPGARGGFPGQAAPGAPTSTANQAGSQGLNGTGGLSSMFRNTAPGPQNTGYNQAPSAYVQSAPGQNAPQQGGQDGQRKDPFSFKQLDDRFY